MVSVGHGALLPLPYSQGRLACSSSNGQTFSSSPKTKLSDTGHKKHMALGSFKLTDIFWDNYILALDTLQVWNDNYNSLPHLSPQAGLVSPGAWTPEVMNIKNILACPVGLDTHRQIKKHNFHLSEVWGRNPNWRINPNVDICLPKEITLWCTKVKSKYWNFNISKY